MLKLRRDEGPLSGEDYSRFSDLVHEVLDARTDAGFRRWLQGSLQYYMPHDVFIAAWGDFNLGVVQFEVVSAIKEGPGFDDAEPVKQLMTGLFSRWTTQDRRYFSLNVGVDGFQLGGTAGPLAQTMLNMKSALVHGINDQRGGRDFIYAFFSQYPKRRGNEAHAIKLLLPYLDVAFRQIAPATAKTVAAATVPAAQPEVLELNGNALNEAEIKIMQLASAGKANEEIGEVLDVSLFTVKNTMQRIFQKLDVFNRSQAIAAFKTNYPQVAGAR